MSREPAPCGTAAGYKRHQRRKEPACRECKDWFNAAQRWTRSSGRGHLVLVFGQAEPAGLCECDRNEAHWAGDELWPPAVPDAAPAEMSVPGDRISP